MRTCTTSSVVALHTALKKALHSFSASCDLLGPNLPDVWVPPYNTSHSHILQTKPWSIGNNAAIFEGKAIAKHIKSKVADEISMMKSGIGKCPRLAVVLVGDRRDSHTFIQFKLKACDQVGIETMVAQLPDKCSENELLHVVAGFNDDPGVHGIIVQLPLPQHLDEEKIINIVSPKKDVDGFHPLNMGNLAKRGRKPFFIPCAPKACIALLLRNGVEIKGKRAVIIGRSKIAGLPTALLLQRHHATVSVLHAYTKKPEQITSEADIVVADVGIPNMVRHNWLKQGAVVIDMGTNQVKDPISQSFHVTGDVCFKEAVKVASAITPVPGGVGPVTISMLLSNTLDSAKHAFGLI
ncbi:PREDICTED: bifunctional protein FolD 1, mitochondrial-like [Lupinus angustifolius]|uniref:bifunctional protein FolD 1, mitochondrial-like n=1 Tax=Lupinus angustifolius TaxID=3871 RepID=UPI00092E299B|nr:PREDICTED: bifunctional protein FolD 1, mitochondrial-like [Lupinus angustifolius]